MGGEMTAKELDELGRLRLAAHRNSDYWFSVYEGLEITENPTWAVWAEDDLSTIVRAKRIPELEDEEDIVAYIVAVDKALPALIAAARERDALRSLADELVKEAAEGWGDSLFAPVRVPITTELISDFSAALAQHRGETGRSE
jgi:hypothetical protein